MHLIPTLLLMGAMLCTAMASVHAEVIKRVNPDGSVSIIVPQHAPSGGAILEVPASLQLARIKQERARDAYNASLEKLKGNPTCAECRQEALRLGREYRAMLREDGNLTIYDEAAIANDIAAAGGTK